MTKTSAASSSARPVVVVDGLSFALNGQNVSYRLRVGEASGDLIGCHFGGVVDEDPPAQLARHNGGWSEHAHERREFPDLGRGDFRSPALHIKHQAGHTVSHFKYKSHVVVPGKPALPGLPCTFGGEDDVTTLVLRLEDSYSNVVAELSYSVFPKFDAIVRSVKITNNGKEKISIEKLASFSVDFPYSEYEMLQLQGEWTRECHRIRRKVDYGTQGFGSSTGYSSHLNNPFLGLVTPTTTETAGDAWGFSLVYTGSFNVEVEMNSQGLTRTLVGMNPYQFSWPLKHGESFVSPECVSVFSNAGVGAMSRQFHRLYRQHLIKSKFVNQPRPVLLNGWEGVYFDFDEKVIYNLAEETAKLGMKLFVLDDGWFGSKHPRLNDHTSLGDWQVNRARFPNGLGPLVERVKKLRAAESDEALQFGLWVEPEMISKTSELYEQHPEWALHAGEHVRSENRHQLVLNVALTEVQDFIIKSISDILEDAPITYIKWDNNRGMHESSSPHNYHAYMLGMYRVFETLTTKFPNVIWEGCASGGGRFDAGILQYFPQIWTSDGTDAFDRIHIQFGTSLVYPASTMGAHLSAVPNEVTRRVTPLKFRAHVAMMGGSFGLELDPREISDEDRAELPELIALAEKTNPVIISGDMYRLALPESSNFPAALFVAEDGSRAVLFAFQMRRKQVHNFPMLRLQGLDHRAKYRIDGKDVLSGASLMNGGLQIQFTTDYDSRVSIIERI